MFRKLTSTSKSNIKKKISPVLLIIFLLLAVLILFQVIAQDVRIGSQENPTKEEESAKKATFADQFSADSTLSEVGSLSGSKSPDWWLNSGAYLNIKDGVASTIQGNLASGDKWRQLYNKNNPAETDNGAHPQNIFRLVTRSKWRNYSQEAYFKINRNNFSTDPHRDASNGLLLFNRYRDGNNLYYAGLRVDGTVVIKKKTESVYYTMAQKRIYTGAYDRNNNQNLLPQNQWTGVKTEVRDTGNGVVNIRLYIDAKRDKNWQLVLEANDSGRDFGGRTISNEGFAGIRTDFMDVEFDDYKITETN